MLKWTCGYVQGRSAEVVLERGHSIPFVVSRCDPPDGTARVTAKAIKRPREPTPKWAFRGISDALSSFGRDEAYAVAEQTLEGHPRYSDLVGAIAAILDGRRIDTVEAQKQWGGLRRQYGRRDAPGTNAIPAILFTMMLTKVKLDASS